MSVTEPDTGLTLYIIDGAPGNIDLGACFSLLAQVLESPPWTLEKSTVVDWEIYRARLGNLPRLTGKSTAPNWEVYRARLASLPRQTS